MNEFLIVIGFAVLPAFGNLLGASFAGSVKPPRWVVGATLHGAAGIAIALASIELMPRIVDALSALAVVAAFTFGAAVFVGHAGGHHSRR